MKIYRTLCALSALAQIASLLIIGAESAFGVTYSYNSATGTFGDGSKWRNTSNDTTGNVPGSSDTANITSSGTQVNFLDNRTVNAVTIGNFSTLILNAGTLDVNQLRVGQSGQGSISRQGGILRPDKVTITNNSALDIVDADEITVNTEITVSGIGSNLFYNHTDSDRMIQLFLHEGGAATLVSGTLRTSYLDLGKEFGFVPSEIFRVDGKLDVFTTVNIRTGSELKIEAGDTFTTAVINVLGAGSKLNLQGNALTSASLNLGGGTLVRDGANIHVGSLSVGAPDTFAFASGDTMGTGGRLDVGGTLDLQGSISNRLSGVFVSAGGTLILNGDISTSYLNVEGSLIRNGGRLNVGRVDVKDAQLTIFSSDTVEEGGGLVANAGSVINYNNAQSILGLVSASGGTINLNGHNLQVGDVSVGGSGMLNRGGANLTGIRSISVTGGSTLAFQPTDTIAGGGTIQVTGPGSTLTLNSTFASPATTTSILNGGVLNLDGHDLKTGSLVISTAGGATPGTLNRSGGRLELKSLNIQSGTNFNIQGNDQITPGGTFTVLHSGTTLNYDNASTATLERLTIQNGTVDLQGGTLRTKFLDLGEHFSAVPGYIEHNGGALQVTTLATVGNGSSFEVGDGDDLSTATLWVHEDAALDLAGNLLPVKNLMLWGDFNRNGGNLDLQSLSLVLGNTLDLQASDTIREGGTIGAYGAGTTLNFNNATIIGAGNGAVSQLTVAEGATLDLQGGTLRTSNFSLGSEFGSGNFLRSGGGVLQVLSAATLAGGSMFTIAASDDFSTASVTVAAGSTLDLAGNALAVGNLSLSGTLNRNGGHFIFGGLTVGADQDVSLDPSDTMATGGSLSVAGSNSVLHIETNVSNTLSSVNVGNGGALHLNGSHLSTDQLSLSTATLRLDFGAELITNELSIVSSSAIAFNDGTLTVKGFGQFNNYSMIGDGTNAAVLNLSNNGVSPANYYFGENTVTVANHATVNYDGRRGAVLDVSDIHRETIGGGPAGVFNWVSGGIYLHNAAFNVSSTGQLGASIELTADRTMVTWAGTTIGGGASLTLSGGVLVTDSLTNAGGTFTYTGGNLSIFNGGVKIGVDGITSPAGIAIADSDSIELYNGALTIEAGRTVELNGGSLAVGSVVGSESLSYNSGVLRIGVGDFSLTSASTDLAAGSQIELYDGTLAVGAGKTLSLNGGRLTTRSLDITGTVAFNSGNLVVTDDDVALGPTGDINGTPMIQIDEGSSLQVYRGTLTVQPNQGLTVDGGYVYAKTLVASSQIEVDSGQLNAGTIFLGTPAGGGQVTVDIEGSVRCDRIARNNLVINGGSFEVTYYSPEPGQEDPVLDNSIVGGYTHDSAMTINSGHVFTPNMKIGVTPGFTDTVTINGGELGTDNLWAAGGAGSILVFNGGTINTSHSVIDGPSILTVGNGVSDATLNFTGGTHSFADGLAISTSGHLTGYGAITANVANEGRIAPFVLSGTIEIAGDLASTGVLDFGILSLPNGGTEVLKLFGQVHINGNFEAGGVIAVNLSPIVGYETTPNVGDSFDLMDFGSLTDSGYTFDFTKAALPVGMIWDTSAFATSGNIRVAAGVPGDFNYDITVDAADYVMWRRALGSTYAQNDYNIWRTHFGQTVGSGSGAGATAAVPEPAIAVMLMFVATVSCLLRRRAA